MQSTNVHYYPAGQQPPPPYHEVPPGSFAPPPNMIGGQSVTIVQPGVSMEGATVIVGTPIGSKPTVTTCRSCQAQIVSRVVYRPTMRTHLIALLLCLFICWPCVCVPYCVDSCNNADHFCPNCNAYIGSYKN